MRKLLLPLAAILACISFGGSFVWLVDLTTRVAVHAELVCKEHKLLANIAKEEVQELIDNQKKFLRPNVNIPGLTHAELVESSERKIRNKSTNLIRLEKIAKETC